MRRDGGRRRSRGVARRGRAAFRAAGPDEPGSCCHERDLSPPIRRARSSRCRPTQQSGSRGRPLDAPGWCCSCGSWQGCRCSRVSTTGRGLRHCRTGRRASRLSRCRGRPATVFFAVIDLVAAVGLWLAAAWGAVVWLTACVSMAAVEVFFPQVYGGRIGGDRRGDPAVRLSVPCDSVGTRASAMNAVLEGR